MRNLVLFSDDSHDTPPEKSAIVVAGVVLDGDVDRRRLREDLSRIEIESNKGQRDWYSTRPFAVRAEYIEAVLALPSIKERVFFRAIGVTPNVELEALRAATIHAALISSADGEVCVFEVRHEGLKSNPRYRLREDLSDLGLRRRLRVEPAIAATSVEVRLSDALAGYIRTKRFGLGGADFLPAIPDWVLEIRPINDKPPGVDAGGQSQTTVDCAVLGVTRSDSQ